MRSPSHSSTERRAARSRALALALLAACVAGSLSACGGDAQCGPAEAPADGISATIDGQAFTYSGFTSSPNNDCTPPGATLTSLTLDGLQADPAPPIPQHLTFCLPRPETLDDGSITLPDERVQVIDVFADDGTCATVIDRTVVPTGTIEFVGYCDDGADLAGYAVVLSITVGGIRTCTGQPAAPVSIIVSGTGAVETLVF